MAHRQSIRRIVYTLMNHESTTTPLPMPNIPKYHAVFKCYVDKGQYTLPIIFLSIFGVFILIISPRILLGIIGILLGLPPLAFVLFLSRHFWKRVTYTIDDKILTIATPFKSLVINIDSIKIIKRGKFWVEKGCNYSASYIKLRIIYDRSSYIYVSPENEVSFINMLRAINPDIKYSSERGL